MWQKLMWKIWYFESMIYRKIWKVPEGGMLPPGAMVVRKIFHPGIIFKCVKHDPCYNAIDLYGVKISMEFIQMQKGKFRDGTWAHRRNGQWEYWNMQPGEWAQFTMEGVTLYGMQPTPEQIPLPKDLNLLLPFVDRIYSLVREIRKEEEDAIRHSL
jgi:hypothetical protein